MNDNPESSRNDALRDARKQITSSLFLALAALGVIVFACYGWFVSNSNVSGSNISVSASGSRFELASVGDIKGIFDEKLSGVDKVEGSDWKDNGKITNSDRTILWRVSGSSNLGNLNVSTGIEPGKDGTLQFYVVPQGVDSLNLTFTLEIIPLVENQEYKFVQLSDSVAEDFLKGHLLVRYRVGEERDSTLIDPASGTFPKDDTLTVGANPTLISLDWSWPYLLEDAIADDQVKSIVNFSPELFLCKQLYPDVTTLEAPFTLPDKSNPLFRLYSNYYNNADQYIGTNVDAILFRLTAVEG